MSTLTEIGLFKACIDAPQVSKIRDLNMDRVMGPSNAAELSDKEVMIRKATKLYHMAWSGVTKYLRTVCQVKQRPVEFPGLGILMPVCVGKSAEEEG